MTEWRPVPGYPGYTVSDDGQVRGVRPAGRNLKPLKGRGNSTRHQVALFRDGQAHFKQISVIVAWAFIGPKPTPDSVVRHLNDDPTDNRAENLAYGSYSDNANDAVKNGHHPGALKTECKHGHSLDQVNTYVDKHGNRSCKQCRRAAMRAYYNRTHPGKAGQVRCSTCGQYVEPAKPHDHHDNWAADKAYR